MIFSVYHKLYPHHIGDHQHVIKVGPNKGNFIMAGLSDDTGDNISDRNSNFCELTAMYWVWKNYPLEELSYVGFSHYRRHFNFITKSRRKDKTDIDEQYFRQYIAKDHSQTILDYLSNHDLILTRRYRFRKFSIAKNYMEKHIPEEWEIMMDVLKNYDPECYHIALNFFYKKGVKFYGGNMFISKIDWFKEYMEWLIPLMMQVDKRLRYSAYPYQARTIGFLGERILSLYVHYSQFKVKQVNMSFLSA